MQALKTVRHQGYTIEVYLDEFGINPRTEYDHLGTILYTSSRYVLGDKQVSPEEIKAITSRDDVFWLPVYAMIHSGTMLNTTGFSCPWDSGQCGIIYCEKGQSEAWGFTAQGEALREAVKACFVSEIEEYSRFCSGESYGFVIRKVTAETDSEDSCWGFSSIEEAIENAKAFLPKPDLNDMSAFAL
jgi:hypothetical protein